ncbi:hypothetical protein Q5O89_07510 [Peribacillus frigoritolerans]|nr:hypothetical protein [Peribacillus frigoritolerans]
MFDGWRENLLNPFMYTKECEFLLNIAMAPMFSGKVVLSDKVTKE